jgi:nitrite reductase (NAD(P)H)
VVGGGLLGLEAAKAVYDLQTVDKVSIINRQAFPLSRQLDDDGGEIVLRRIQVLGVNVFVRTTVKDLITVPNLEDGGNTEALSGLQLESTVGKSSMILDCNLVIFAVGITPRDDLAKAAGITCYKRGGIIVDDFLQTSAPDVYAIGECASWKGQTYGLIGPGSKSASACDVWRSDLTVH